MLFRFASGWLLGAATFISTTTLAAGPALSVRVRAPDGVFEGSSPRATPLGSLWKLFVYAQQVETAAMDARYTCRGANPEELFCCTPGATIDRDLALAKSCSPYFEPTRLGLKPLEWKSFWTSRLPDAPQWLANLESLKPETRVNVDELLRVLSQLRSLKTFARIEAASVGTVLEGTGSHALSTYGSLLRVKTFTWRDDETKPLGDAQGFLGGFAGWLPDGSTIYVGRAGHGTDALRGALQGAFHEELREIIERHAVVHNVSCVSVRFFDRYPLAEPHADGPLRGPITLNFKNQNTLSFTGDGSLRFERGRVVADLSETEYVARVIDREVKSAPLEAARAFSVAIRTYLWQNAKRVRSCLEIADSSRLQRVSPAPASSASLKIARWSEGLVLDRIPALRYHSTKAAENQLSWTQARELAESGFNMREILRVAYPGAKLHYGALESETPCAPNPLAAKWLGEQSKQWQRKLLEEPGFEKPQALKVCESRDRVFARLQTEEVYVPRVRSREDEISVAHEYLHIAFRAHPRGRDEKFIERLARSLSGEK